MDDLNFEVGADKEQRVKSLTEEQIKKYGRFIEKIVIAAAKDICSRKNRGRIDSIGILIK